MITRFARALALSLVLMFGWSGVAAAQTPAAGSYDFSFSSVGFDVGGGITLSSGGMISAINDFLINGVEYRLDKSGAGIGIGTAPKVFSTIPQRIFTDGGPNGSNYFVVRSSDNPSNRIYFSFGASSNGSSDYAATYQNGSFGVPSFATSDSLTAVPAPTPAAA